MQNYNYIALSPQKKIKERPEEEGPLIESEIDKFKLNAEPISSGMEKTRSKSVSVTEKQKVNLNRPNTQPNPGSKIDPERRQFVQTVITDLNKKVEQINQQNNPNGEQEEADKKKASAAENQKRSPGEMYYEDPKKKL